MDVALMKSIILLGRTLTKKVLSSATKAQVTLTLPIMSRFMFPRNQMLRQPKRHYNGCI